MNSIHFFVEGIPKAQPRTKACNRGKHAGVYDPGTADDWKTLVMLEAKKHKPENPIDEPCTINLFFYFPRPKRLMRKKDPVECIPYTQKPDKDNLDKAVLDSLVKVGMLKDDSIVFKGTTAKQYNMKNENKSGVSVFIYWGYDET